MKVYALLSATHHTEPEPRYTNSTLVRSLVKALRFPETVCCICEAANAREEGKLMSTPSARLAELGLSLPEPAKPVASYLPTVRTGSLVFVSGQLPMSEGKLLATGNVPGDVPLEDAQRCARQCLLNALAALTAEIGSIDRVRRVVRLGCFVSCEAGFTDQPKVANGASDLLFEIFDEAGRHARAAVGSVALPLGAPVEIEFIFEVE